MRLIKVTLVLPYFDGRWVIAGLADNSWTNCGRK
jgi:hypothetical protein